MVRLRCCTEGQEWIVGDSGDEQELDPVCPQSPGQNRGTSKRQQMELKGKEHFLAIFR